MRRMYRDNARAAFLAVMEPSAAMLHKGEKGRLSERLAGHACSHAPRRLMAASLGWKC
jgi:hypothetical protein